MVVYFFVIFLFCLVDKNVGKVIVIFELKWRKYVKFYNFISIILKKN